MHGFANPTRFLNIARPLTPWFLVLGLATIAFALGAGLFYTPPDYLQGDSVRIMYVHVPTIWLGMAGWAGILVAGVMQLVWKHPLAGIAGRAIAVPGAMFTALGLITGSIWGRPTWGTWWVWDGRLTSALVLFFLYLGYIALASASEEQGGTSKMAAIFGIVGAINLPIIHYSVTWWNSIHQVQSITLQGSTIDMAILWPMLVSMAGFTLLFAAIVLMRMRTIIAGVRIEARLRRMAEG
ncbi:MAG: heme ABC transporter permease CcmC [Parasphingopyxis sp.]|uniref:heme ABC transporter permease CcmC n=1 Tax=Parasphingopyxis sp. TaxID=1920299 RepID=UPI00262D304B|nr:heme ABC transporter permease CcmC [uncultured Parasphingopyxis sp.]